MLGFWIYLMSDCLIFAVLFACFGVLGGNYAAGPSPKDVFELPLIAVNTTMLLLYSITYGFAVLAMQRQSRCARRKSGSSSPRSSASSFLAIELLRVRPSDRRGRDGPQLQRLSCRSFFTLVGTHGLHA